MNKRKINLTAFAVLSVGSCVNGLDGHKEEGSFIANAMKGIKTEVRHNIEFLPNVNPEVAGGALDHRVADVSMLHKLKSYMPFVKAKAAIAAPAMVAGALGNAYYNQQAVAMPSEAVVNNATSFAKFKSVLVNAKNAITGYEYKQALQNGFDIIKNNKTGSVMAGSAIAATIGLVAYNRYNAKPAEPAEEAVKPTKEVVKPTKEVVKPTKEVVKPTEEAVKRAQKLSLNKRGAKRAVSQVSKSKSAHSARRNITKRR